MASPVTLKTVNSDAILESLRGPQPGKAELRRMRSQVPLDKDASFLLGICPPTLQYQMLEVLVNRMRRVSALDSALAVSAAVAAAVQPAEHGV